MGLVPLAMMNLSFLEPMTAPAAAPAAGAMDLADDVGIPDDVLAPRSDHDAPPPPTEILIEGRLQTGSLPIPQYLSAGRISTLSSSITRQTGLEAAPVTMIASYPANFISGAKRPPMLVCNIPAVFGFDLGRWSPTW